MSVKERPILFNTVMVRATLEDRKIETRRLIKPQPVMRLAYCYAGSHHGTWSYPGGDTYKYWGDEYKVPDDISEMERSQHWRPPCHADDILYVRETWAESAEGYAYKADYPDSDGWGWRPSIHMPKEAARIWLRVTVVRVERLQSITEAGAVAEGCKAGCMNVTGGPWGVEDDPDEWTAKEQFTGLWDSTIKPADRGCYGWAANPWVWVIEFEKATGRG